MSSESHQNKDAHKKPFWRDFLETIIIFGLAFFIIQGYVGRTFIVVGDSMFPTFHNKDYLIVDKLTYHFIHEPVRGEVIIFHPPTVPKTYYIKRVIGLPGETVMVKGNDVTIKNSEHPEGFIIKDYSTSKGVIDTALTLGEDEYFVMGDNRGNSLDSRSWGALPRKNIVGRPILRLFPFSAFDGWPGM